MSLLNFIASKRPSVTVAQLVQIKWLAHYLTNTRADITYKLQIKLTLLADFSIYMQFLKSGEKYIHLC